MNKKIIYIIFVLVFFVLVLGVLSFTLERKAIKFVKRNGNVFSELIDSGQPIHSTFKEEKVDVWNGKHQMYEFILGYGIGDAQYFGVYYFPDDVPLPFQNFDTPLIFNNEEEYWTWQAEGDNHGMTKKISDKWYYFEAAF